MGSVIVELSMSLDGFIARPNNGVDEVFAWYFAGTVAVPMPNKDLVFKVDPASADIVRESFRRCGANVTGRRTFDDAGAWGGKDPFGLPSFIVSHSVPPEWAGPDSPFTFVTDGVASAIAQAKAAAGAKDVGVAAASIAQQCLQQGLVDEIHLHVAPVLLGSGVRLFDNLDAAPIALEQIFVRAAPGVTHLRFRVLK